MARKKKASKATTRTEAYRHASSKRKNIPQAKIAGEGRIPRVKKAEYAFNPHLPPKLLFDSSGRADQLPDLLKEAYKRALTLEEARQLGDALRSQQPWLEWTQKREHDLGGSFEVDPVALHLHERVSAKAVLATATRMDIERSLFADPEQDYNEAIQFYQHDIDWANRLILGDSLSVMSSLAHREDLAGKVQMIYIDPPYGIRFSSNFQPQVGQRDVKDKDTDLTRESEMVQAYRDTWHLGIHSYLSYLRNRLIVARELLADSGSIFVQIGEENLHRVRQVMDEIFGAANSLALVTFKTGSGFKGRFLKTTSDYLLWYARDRNDAKFRRLFTSKPVGADSYFSQVLLPNGEIRGLDALPHDAADVQHLALRPLVSGAYSESTTFHYKFRERDYFPGSNRCWKTTQAGLDRLAKSERIHSSQATLKFITLFQDYPCEEVTHVWNDTMELLRKDYVVQTTTKVIERCLHMTTDPGDLVLDPTCGSGTTAYVAEKWGRRWITIDTSRVALALARQRLLTAKFDRYLLSGEQPDDHSARGCSGIDPSVNFSYSTVPHITLASIARNTNLDPIFTKHEAILDVSLEAVNVSLSEVDDRIRLKLAVKLAEKLQEEGLRATTDADRRRWLLPGTTKKQLQEAFVGKSRLTKKHVNNELAAVPPDEFEHWHMPFDTDDDWPKALAQAVAEYREAWHAKMDAVNACIAANAEQETLVDQPEKVPGVVRVTGPFTVEGVIPEELSIHAEGLFGDAPEDLEVAEIVRDETDNEIQNLDAYLGQMLRYISQDGVTFLNNQVRCFARVEPLYEAATGTPIHAEAAWDEDGEEGAATVAIGFGPQHGPVTTHQVEDLIHAARANGYSELVIAGFSFAPEATGTLSEIAPGKLHVHFAHIRPDINPSMNGLLKDTPNSQLFTVFGLPDVEVRPAEDGEYTAELKGVDIYDPVKNVITSTGAAKVAAWFLDSDYDSRTFCITQAFFPDQNAWEKLAKALKDVIDASAFAAFKGTVSLPFEPGKHNKIAVKVIDPRGNEVMTVHRLST